ncbi:FAD-dependent oxidoreductase [Hyphobacterium marinum]|uniref:FAD-dependent oxidoreductase n=1 Tax=Hyphobacterium marinum TaxID=3116574 RepID=A0ABU7LUC0_9PROT|nr:FAD-dependent oxidoreductase [Hyphobacterium sp. Y6023]MEE2565081.1 FAD-dependent oxidoreductase [Hyphobacterium sp. Y6023]
MTEQNNSRPADHDFEAGVPLSAFEDQTTLTGQAGETPVIVSCQDGEYRAFEAVCSHYGASLAEGAFSADTVRCPLHHACFSLRTGAAIAAPAFGPLTRRSVVIANGQVTVGAAIDTDAAGAPCRARASDPHRIVLVGSGAAAFAAADTLRKEGYAGELVMVSEDEDRPYDRPNLSKDYLAGSAPPEWMPLQSWDFYDHHDIEILAKTRVTRLDLNSARVETDQHGALAYDRLLLATGARARTLPLPGAPEDRVFTLRSMADAKRLIAAVESAQNIAIVGAGFIGLEVSASLRQRGKAITIISNEAEPFAASLGPEIGRHVRQLHEANGVRFIGSASVRDFDGQSVTLDGGDSVSADLVVVGIGAIPNDALAAEAGLPVEDGILVDADLQTAVPGVFAAGDVARHRNDWAGRPTREEHWVAAQRQGQIAARNMLGAQDAYNEAPFFWTHQFDMTLKVSGLPGVWDRISVSGSIPDNDFVASYYEGPRLRAVASAGREHESTVLHEQLNALHEQAARPGS